MAKRFDPEQALDRAMQVFWARGYCAASAQDLVEGMGVNRGSLYATYGSKLGLYRLALQRYVDHTREQDRAVVAELRDPLQAVRALLERYADELTAGPDGCGCMLVNGAAEARVVHPDVVADVERAIGGMREDWVGLLRERHWDGAIDAEAAAVLLRVLTLGLRVLGQATDDRAQLQAAIDAGLALLER